jgi:hypothetical protein
MIDLVSSADVEPLVLSFRVKFYPADPSRLTANGKLMLYQQLKRDLRHGRLYCSTGEAAALGALITQGKFELVLIWRILPIHFVFAICRGIGRLRSRNA